MSAPAKRIMLVDADEKRGSILRFMLRVNGFCVHLVADAEEVDRSKSADLMIGCWAFDGEAVEKLRRHLDCPLLILRFDHAVVPAVPCNRALVKGHTSSADIVDAARTLCAHKRGPRKFQPQPAV